MSASPTRARPRPSVAASCSPRSPDAARRAATRRCYPRAIQTANIALDVADRAWIPVDAHLASQRAPLRCAAGHGQGGNAREVRHRAVQAWRRTFDAPPPELDDDDRVQPGERPALRGGIDGDVPRTETPEASSSTGCCRTGSRTSPPTYAAGKTVLVTAHGNTLRASRQAPRRHQRRRHRRAQHPDRHPPRLRLDDDFSRRPGRVPRPRGRRCRRRRGREPGEESNLTHPHAARGGCRTALPLFTSPERSALPGADDTDRTGVGRSTRRWRGRRPSWRPRPRGRRTAPGSGWPGSRRRLRPPRPASCR